MEESSLSALPAARSGVQPAPPASTPQSGYGRSTCSTCGNPAPVPSSGSPYVIAVGNITAAFPSLSVEKEFAQVLSRTDFKGMTDRETMHAVLSRPENRFLARRICWQLTVLGGGSSPTYVLVPEEPSDVTLLVDTLRRHPSKAEIDVVAGVISGIAPPAMCNAQQIPIIKFCQLYSFAVEAMIKLIPRKAERATVKEFELAGKGFFSRLMDLASNGTGLTRALTYATLHYASLYELVSDKLAEDSALSRVDIRPSSLDPDRADIYLKFIKRDTGFCENYRFSVNVGGPFPYLEESLHLCFEASAA